MRTLESVLGAACTPCAGAERIPGLTWRPVRDTADVAAALEDGSQQRATSATAMNASSSRSHAVLSVRVSPADGAGRPSLLHLVDLAGEEGCQLMPCCSDFQCFSCGQAELISPAPPEYMLHAW